MSHQEPLHARPGRRPRRQHVAWWHTRLADDDNVQAALRRVADAGCHLLSNCQAASVTIIELGRPLTVASTGDAALAADAAQYDVDDGPCLTAARQQHIVLDRRRHRSTTVGRPSAEPPSPTASSRRCRSRSTSAHRAEAASTCTANQPGAFTADDQDLATGFAAQASIVVANAQAYWAAFDATKNLTTALESRAVIEQAKGVLIARHGYQRRRRLQRAAASVPSSEPQAAGHRHRDRRSSPPGRQRMNDIEALDAARRHLSSASTTCGSATSASAATTTPFTLRSYLVGRPPAQRLRPRPHRARPQRSPRDAPSRAPCLPHRLTRPTSRSAAAHGYPSTRHEGPRDAHPPPRRRQ